MEPISVGRIPQDGCADAAGVARCLEQATWYGDFRVIGEPDRAAEPNAALALVHDETYLHLGLRAEEPCIGAVRARALPSDEDRGGGSIHGDDRFEIFIDSENEAQGFAYLVVNCRGALLSWWFHGNSHRQWHGPSDWACEEWADGWRVRLSIPLCRFQYSRASQEGWSINVMRVRVVEQDGVRTEMSTAALLTGPAKLFNPTSFRTMQLQGDIPQRYFWSVRALGRKRVSHPNGQWQVELPIRIAHLVGPETQVAMMVKAKAGDAFHEHAPIKMSLGEGETHDDRLHVCAPEPADGEFTIVLKDPDREQTLHESQISFDSEDLSWKPHPLLQGDGRGGYSVREARLQVLPRVDGMQLWPFSMVAMDNGEIALLGTVRDSSSGVEKAHIGFSCDGGANWSAFGPIGVPDAFSRPMMAAYLGDGVLTFNASEGKYMRYFSHDYGRTWTEKTPLPPAANGLPFQTEGNPLIDRDEQGRALRIAEIGCNVGDGGYPRSPFYAELRWSADGGRTWHDPVAPPKWQRDELWQGQTYARGVSEGALVRAANGFLVAALRTDMPARYFETPNMGDALEGTAISISKDEGKTWSELIDVCESGRHHGNLVKLPDGDLVLTVIRRIDIRNGRLHGYRRGCDAIISRDNGLTWRKEEMIVLDEFNHCAGEDWVQAECGHLCSIALDDGSVLTTYGNYLTGAILIHWTP